MSKGLGKDYYDGNRERIFDVDVGITRNGVRQRIPRYFAKLDESARLAGGLLPRLIGANRYSVVVRDDDDHLSSARVFERDNALDLHLSRAGGDMIAARLSMKASAAQAEVDFKTREGQKERPDYGL